MFPLTTAIQSCIEGLSQQDKESQRNKMYKVWTSSHTTDIIFLLYNYTEIQRGQVIQINKSIKHESYEMHMGKPS